MMTTTTRRRSMTSRWMTALLLMSSCGWLDAAPRGEQTVHFGGRSIDLEPFLLGFPYSRFGADLESGRLTYVEKSSDGTRLRELSLEPTGTIDLEAGRRLGDTDWSTRTMGRPKLHAPSQRYLLTSDERNDERLNVYAIDIETGALQALTDSDYIYGWSLSDDDRYLAYLSRSGREEPFDTTLIVRDLSTGAERRILSDGGGIDRFTWCSPRFTADNDSVVVVVQHDGQRNTTSLARIDLTASEPAFEYVHPPRVVRYGVSMIEGWISDHEFLFTSSESGSKDLYRVDTRDWSPHPVKRFDEELGSVRPLETEPPTALAIVSRPTESHLLLLDPWTGKPSRTR